LNELSQALRAAKLPRPVKVFAQLFSREIPQALPAAAYIQRSLFKAW